MGEEPITKSVHTREYEEFLRHLRSTRVAAGLNIREVAERLNESFLYVSRCERGERRMDVVELHAYCRAIGKSPVEFMQELETFFR